MVFWGSGASLQAVWDAADMALGLMTVVNVTALVLLTPTIAAVSKDYLIKKEKGGVIGFSTSDCRVQGKTADGIWE